MLTFVAVLTFTAVLLAAVGFLETRRKPPESGPDQEPTPQKREPFLDRFERLALQAGLTWKRSAYLTAVAAGLLLALLLALLGQAVLAMLAVLAGVAGPMVYVQRLRAARMALFSRQIPQALFLAGSVLRSGGSLMQGISAVATEMPAPLGAEFRHIEEQVLLGMPVAEAMARAQERVAIPEFAAVVVAVRITSELGGNLAHIFDQIARSIVDAQNAGRTIMAFTTEGRASANMIAALPFVVMGIMHLLSPTYFRPLFTTWPGRALLIVCVSAIALGWRTVRRMVEIRPF